MYGLFIVPIVTGFFSVLGMSIERFQVKKQREYMCRYGIFQVKKRYFQTFALYRDRRKVTKKFAIAWSVASWTLGSDKSYTKL